MSAILLSYDDNEADEYNYYYDQGVYYQGTESKDNYKVVQAPEGAEITELPSGYTTTVAEKTTYYYHGGVFYKQTEKGYKVVTAPIGAIVYKLPEGGEEIDSKGNKLIKFNGAYYQPIMHDGEDAYEVVKYNG